VGVTVAGNEEEGQSFGVVVDGTVETRSCSPLVLVLVLVVPSLPAARLAAGSDSNPWDDDVVEVVEVVEDWPWWQSLSTGSW
jgi:hypothetical protein